MSNCYIQLTNTDRAAFGTSIVLIMKDKQNNFQRVSLYGFNQDSKNVKEKFHIGCILKIKDPYMRQSYDGSPVIKVFEPSQVEFL